MKLLPELILTDGSPVLQDGPTKRPNKTQPIREAPARSGEIGRTAADRIFPGHFLLDRPPAFMLIS